MRKPDAAQDAVIIEAVRSPVGRGHAEKGVFRNVHPADLLGQCYQGVLQRAGIDPALIDNVIAGCANQIAEQSSGIARSAWLQKGLPAGTGATTVDIRCGSGQQAAHFASSSIRAGIDRAVIAAGVEHMGRNGFRVNQGAQEHWGQAFTAELRSRYALVSQGVAAERLADAYRISRAEMDEFSAHSHQRAAAAARDGHLAREIHPIDADGVKIDADQGIRPDSTPEALATLKPVFAEDGKVTAGNSSQISDGAAAILLTSGQFAQEMGLRPRARVVDQVVLGVDPVEMLTGPIVATKRILERNDLRIHDIDAIEINEAFASVVLAWQREFQPDMSRLNAWGGAIAIGHPLGATGARLLTTIVNRLEHTDSHLGLVTICCGGGLGTAMLIERL
ncbi:acetyl-CoA acetyltransferase [Nocardia sp. 852002-20019_SCH5090214]|uniref:thiolase family protein n=1 Tax=Nocardia sp. 852002-20019_SCH5090214 TaxID=1834087 RepID=UPI0007EAB8F0|nr:thiolase family protein [Nocardia sp. 852002-20019_SCH5090214]OBA54307.1 acetyl-CoA acetyltransferase [Nocardia sp. 852002-20019_SCH5090214]